MVGEKGEIEIARKEKCYLSKSLLGGNPALGRSCQLWGGRSPKQVFPQVFLRVFMSISRRWSRPKTSARDIIQSISKCSYQFQKLKTSAHAITANLVLLQKKKTKAKHISRCHLSHEINLKLMKSKNQDELIPTFNKIGSFPNPGLMYAADQSSSFFKVLKIILTERNYPDKLYNLTLKELKDSNHLAMKYSFQFLSGNA